jgi:hypothetical protein
VQVSVSVAFGSELQHNGEERRRVIVDRIEWDDDNLDHADGTGNRSRDRASDLELRPHAPSPERTRSVSCSGRPPTEVDGWLSWPSSCETVCGRAADNRMG